MEGNTKGQHPHQGGFLEIKHNKPSGHKKEVFQIQSHCRSISCNLPSFCICSLSHFLLEILSRGFEFYLNLDLTDDYFKVTY